MNNLFYNKMKGKAGFMMFNPDDDHILYIKKASYEDAEMYYVIMEDAHRTPTADVMYAASIFRTYGITKEELDEITAWIDVDECKPPKHKPNSDYPLSSNVLLHVDYDNGRDYHTVTGYYDYKKKKFFDLKGEWAAMEVGTMVTHWQPLPSPPIEYKY